ncbi:MAG: phospholipase D-like domain-containing protein, partial [Planctomycetota bacterium]
MRPVRLTKTTLTALVALLGFATFFSPSALAQKKAEVYFAPEDDFQTALVKLLLSGKKSIDIAMYSFHPSSKADEDDYKSLVRSGGISPLDALREANKRGVKVRMILNKATTYVWSKKAVAPLIDAGVEVYSTGATMHQKYAIVDGKRVVSGSGNWSAGAFHRYLEDWVIFPENKSLSDRYQQNFDRLLDGSKRVKLKKGEPVGNAFRRKKSTWKKPKKVAGTKVLFTEENDGSKTTVCEDEIIAWLKKAKKEVVIAVAHFNTDTIAQAVIATKKRGVNVRVLVDLGEFNNRNSQAATIERGKVDLRYHVYSVKQSFNFAKLMHHKFMVVDGTTLLNGSYNWSRTAEHTN